MTVQIKTSDEVYLRRNISISENGYLKTISFDGRIVLYPEYKACLRELGDFDYIWVIFMMHLNKG